MKKNHFFKTMKLGIIVFSLGYAFSGSSVIRPKKPVSIYRKAVQLPSYVGPTFTRIKKHSIYGAALHGDIPILSILLAKGHDPNEKLRYSQNTALHLAAKEGHLPFVEELLKHGAKIDPLNGSGRTPLHIALQSKQLEVAEWLIEHGADIHTQESKKIKGKIEPTNIVLKITIDEWKKLLRSKIEIQHPDKAIRYYIPEEKLTDKQYSHLPIDRENVAKQKEAIQQLISRYEGLILTLLEKVKIKNEKNILLFLEKAQLPTAQKERLKAQIEEGSSPCKASFK